MPAWLEGGPEPERSACLALQSIAGRWRADLADDKINGYLWMGVVIDTSEEKVCLKRLCTFCTGVPYLPKEVNFLLDFFLVL